MPFKDPERKKSYHREYNKEWVSSHPGFRNGYNWKMRGLNPEDAAKKYRSSSICEICCTTVRGPDKHIDHDHQTGRIRGILCSRCNQAIGLLREDEVIITRARDYLINSGESGSAGS